MHFEPPTPPDRAVRALLRRLRDLNLNGHRIAVERGRAVVLRGCRSLDAGIDHGVRYALDGTQDGDHTLRLECAGDGLVARLGERTLAVSCVLDPQGRATLPAIRARIGDLNDPRALARVLRRIVRGLLGRTAPTTPA